MGGGGGGVIIFLVLFFVLFCFCGYEVQSLAFRVQGPEYKVQSPVNVLDHAGRGH